ncbi:hypothetical protein AXF42_Ash019059 [Apostasia shenzhenica]|uniref:Uncharacterized protein n=1 Tax=Apostasia shenzhenica TaxID=1088818 RepID=A0A2I0BB78_9ASPA|nr:hypothetical protein AXF42_Ash019059 [Apostasia shenzhenica]
MAPSNLLLSHTVFLLIIIVTTTAVPMLPGGYLSIFEENQVHAEHIAAIAYIAYDYYQVRYPQKNLPIVMYKYLINVGILWDAGDALKLAWASLTFASPWYFDRSMTSSGRLLLLLLLLLLIFAATTTVATMSLPYDYITAKRLYDDDTIQGIAETGYEAYRDVKHSYTQKPRGPTFLPRLTDERWIAVGMQFLRAAPSLRFCVIFEATVLPTQYRLKAVVQIMFTMRTVPMSAIGQLQEGRIRVNKIEYHSF